MESDDKKYQDHTWKTDPFRKFTEPIRDYMKSIENNKINKKIEEKKLKGNIVLTSNSQKRTIVTIVTIVKGKGNKSSKNKIKFILKKNLSLYILLIMIISS